MTLMQYKERPISMNQKQVVRSESEVVRFQNDHNNYDSQLEFEFYENFNSVHTRLAYRRDLKQFFNFLAQSYPQIKHPKHIEKAHVIAFRNTLTALDLNNRPICTPKTVIRKLAAISSYGAFLVEKRIIHTNPAEYVARPSDVITNETNDLPDEQVKALINSVDESSVSGPMHKAVLLLLFSTGIRKGELINLKLQDYTEQQGIKVIKFIGKRGKVNKIPLHPTAAYFLEKYISYMNLKGILLKPCSYLFQSCKFRNGNFHNKKLQPTSVDYIIKHYSKKIGIKERISPHSARATLIGSLLAQGCDLYKVSQLVNHSNVKTTQNYDKRKKSLTDSPVFKLKYL